jgi:hypothetical protein
LGLSSVCAAPQLDKKNDGRECQKDVVTQQVANCLFLPAGRGRRPKTTRHPSRVDQRSVTPDILCLWSVYQFDSFNLSVGKKTRNEKKRRAKCLTCGAEVISNAHRQENKTKGKISKQKKEENILVGTVPYVI